MKSRFRIALWLPVLLGVLLPRSASAQGCVLCYTSVSATGSTAMRGFEWGIIALLVPALVLFSAVFFLILRRARAANRAHSMPAGAGDRSRAALRLLWFRPAAAARN